MYVKLEWDGFYRRETYLKNLFEGRLSLFLDNLNLSVGTCGIRKTQSVEFLKTFHSFQKGYTKLLEQFRPINKKLLLKYWDLKPNVLELVTLGKVQLPEIDDYNQ